MADRWVSLLQTACCGLVVLSATAAVAADMTTDELRKFLVGRTYVLDVSVGGTLAKAGQATLFFAPDGGVVAAVLALEHRRDGGVLNRIPNGKILQGAWTIKDNTVCVDWKNQPPNPCSRYDKQGDTVTVINVSTGQPRGRIVKSADGNVERLAP